jgi:predicted nucleotidyltransferase
VREEIDVTTARGDLAVRLSELVQRRWSADVQAVGVHGSLAHGDDQDGSDVNLLVVTYRSGSGPQAALRKVEGLRRARELTPRWPLEADRFVTTRALHDPGGWFGKQRDVHLARLAEARPPEFTGLARHNWEMASAAHGRAVRLAEWYETDAALVMIAESRLRTALVAGFLTRTYFRNAADAVKRTGMAAADIQELAAVLKTQADELTARGRPVDGALNALFD